MSKHQPRSLDNLVAGSAAVKAGANPAIEYAAAITKDPTLGLVPAYFTENELRALTGVCRDAENENASRILKAALARGAAK